MNEAQDARFVGEHPDEVLVAPVGGQDPLDHHLALEAGRADRPRLEHLSHSADAQWMQELVVAELGCPLQPPPRARNPRRPPPQLVPQHDRAPPILCLPIVSSPVPSAEAPAPAASARATAAKLVQGRNRSPRGVTPP